MELSDQSQDSCVGGILCNKRIRLTSVLLMYVIYLLYCTYDWAIPNLNWPCELGLDDLLNYTNQQQ